MNPKTIAILLAKDVFAVASIQGDARIAERHWLSRAELVTFGAQQLFGTLVIKACATAHHWVRRDGKQSLPFNSVEQQPLE